MTTFDRLADEPLACLTTVGRRTGKPHRIAIWFSLRSGTMYMLAGGGESADWVKNLRKDPQVRVRVGSRTVSARARVVAPATDENRTARELLDGKYMGWRPGKRLSSWARGALPVAIDLE